MMYFIGSLLWFVFGVVLGLAGVFGLSESVPVGAVLLILALCVFRHMKKRSERHKCEILREYNQKSDYEHMMDDFDLQEKCVFYEGLINILFGPYSRR
ncbi:MAG: hypothetical protein K6F53_09610 [Lachnospiraceae bacterium]|nr:hypothetical protein [Lachnospiraceae bacterium]